MLFRSHGTNLYRYAANSPTNLTDPSGLFSSWKPAWVDAVADAAADLAHSTANYVAEKAEQLFTTIQVGATALQATFHQTINAAGRCRRFFRRRHGRDASERGKGQKHPSASD